MAWPARRPAALGDTHRPLIVKEKTPGLRAGGRARGKTAPARRVGVGVGKRPRPLPRRRRPAAGTLPEDRAKPPRGSRGGGREAGAAGRAGSAEGSPAGEEVKQRVLLLLGAGRHGRAGSAARRSRWRDARGRPVFSPAVLRRPPGPPCARGLRSPATPAASPPVPHRPLRREPGGQLDPGARPSRGGGWAVTLLRGASRRRGAAEVWARIPRAYWAAGGCGRGDLPGWGGVSPQAGLGHRVDEVGTGSSCLVPAPRRRSRTGQA